MEQAFSWSHTQYSLRVIDNRRHGSCSRERPAKYRRQARKLLTFKGPGHQAALEAEMSAFGLTQCGALSTPLWFPDFFLTPVANQVPDHQVVAICYTPWACFPLIDHTGLSPSLQEGSSRYLMVHKSLRPIQDDVMVLCCANVGGPSAEWGLLLWAELSS